MSTPTEAAAKICALEPDLASIPGFREMLADVAARINSGTLLCFAAIEEVAPWVHQNLPMDHPGTLMLSPERAAKYAAWFHRRTASRIAILLWRIVHYGSSTLTEEQIQEDNNNASRELAARLAQRIKQRIQPQLLRARFAA